MDSNVLLAHSGGVSISPKGRQIAFHTQSIQALTSVSRNENKGYYICVMDMDTGDLRPLASGISPAWSPDGRRIAFCRLKGQRADIYVINADGSDPVRITKERASSFNPVWSPDGTRIAFSSGMRTDRRIRNIYVMDADGANQRQLTHTSTVGWWNDHAAWSPDGTQIAYAAGKTNRRGRIQSTIFVMDANGGNRRAIVTQAYYPAWSPDGQKIVFCSNRDGNEEIYMIDADGKNLRRLTNNHYHDTQPAWLSAKL